MRSLSRSIFLLIISSLVTLIVLSNCGDRLTQPSDDTSISFSQRAIIYLSDSTHAHLNKTSTNRSRYYCLVGTLNPEGTVWAYNYDAFNVNLPSGLIKQAQQTRKGDQWLRIRLGNRNATDRPEADTMPKGGASVRTVRCNLPPLPEVLDVVRKKLRTFGSQSWVGQNPDLAMGSTEIPTGSSNLQKSEFVCVEYTVIEYCPNASMDVSDGVDEGCYVANVTGCSKYELITDAPEYDNDNSGGTGGEGGDSGDMCEPTGGDTGLTGPGSDVPMSCEEETDPCETSINDLQNAIDNVNEENLKVVVDFTNEYGDQFGIDNKLKLQHFMSQVAHESTSLVTGERFGVFEENLNYSKERLKEKWPGIFDGANPKLNPTDYAYNPQKMAEFLYGKRPQLGNTQPGDGWKYRGRGVMQLSGRYNYTQFTNFWNNHFDDPQNFVDNPGLLASNDKLAIISALWFFDSRVADNIDINTTVEEVTELINGGDNGKADRKNLFEKIKQFITDCIA